MKNTESIEDNVQKDSFGEGVNFDDPDEIGYYFDDEKQDFELEERGASYFKIYAITTADSLPIFRPDGKKQKYGKRQIISTIDSTTFFIKGVGFKVRNDSSYVQAYIKNVQQGGNLKIESWTDTAITVKYPPLTDSLFIKKTFSIKFKVFRANDKAGKKNVSRVKSKSCISDIQAGKSPLSALQHAAIIRAKLGITQPLSLESIEIPNKTEIIGAVYLIGNDTDRIAIPTHIGYANLPHGYVIKKVGSTITIQDNLYMEITSYGGIFGGKPYKLYYENGGNERFTHYRN